MPAVLCDWEAEQLREVCSCQSPSSRRRTAPASQPLIPEANGQLSLRHTEAALGARYKPRFIVHHYSELHLAHSRYHRAAGLIAFLTTSLLRIIIYHLLKNDGFQFLAVLSSHHVAPQLAASWWMVYNYICCNWTLAGVIYSYGYYW